jgi:hypothetical protein
MTSEEFIIWLKGFIAGSNNYNLTPQGWEALKSNLEEVNDGIDAIIDDGGISEYIRSKKTPPCVGHAIVSDEAEMNERMDIIGQNGNEGLHYNIDPEHENKKIY